MTITTHKKWYISIWSVIVVLFIFNPVTYWVTNYIFSSIGYNILKVNKGPFELVAPTIFGFILHLIVFLLVVRLMMDIKLLGTSE
jgi:hypothetical protein